jgi:6-phospho-beta-glucosidase
MKISVIGCGLRTPLLLHGIAHAQPALSINEIALFDNEAGKAELMASIGGPLAGPRGIRVLAAKGLEQAIEGCGFVISSIRPGGIESRARDERIALEHGFAGQETTGPAGLAMALRTVPVAVEHARLVEKHAPDSWLISFTNPAGLVTQAITTRTGVRAIGICDTPAELFFRIALALNEPPARVHCDYIGLNHLGWVRGVSLDGRDVLDLLLEDDAQLRRLYPAELFPPQLLRATRLIPTEYVFFYQRQQTALGNQRAAGATRGEELIRLNNRVLSDLALAIKEGDVPRAIDVYKSYLNRRNASYMRLEGAAESALDHPDPGWDPFQGETGYHRIAVEAMQALSSMAPTRVVLNVANGGTFADLAPDDVIEAPCLVDSAGPRPLSAGGLPSTIRPLVIAVKEFERLAIRAAEEHSLELACLAMAVNPIAGDWDRARDVVEALVANDPRYLGYLNSQPAPFAFGSVS